MGLKLAGALLLAGATLAGGYKPEEAFVWTTAAKPKPLTDNVNRGLAWLVKHQQEDGGWGQGEESRHMGGSMKQFVDKSNAGDTCAALMALIRAGSTPSKGPHAAQILKGLGYLCGQIEASDKESLFITSVRGTRLQSKLGTYIDTFLASMVLAEVKDCMPNDAGNKQIRAALHKVMDKIERNQKADGSFGGSGWANTLSLSMATKGINRAAQRGVAVAPEVLKRAEENGQRDFDPESGKFKSAKSAGVDLYAAASSMGQMQDSENTNGLKRDKMREIAEDESKPKAEREQARKELERFDRNDKALRKAQDAVIDRLGDKQFIAGFGSNGGEEFLSYMNIGERLVVKGGDAWEKWDRQITKNLNGIQNNDGSWTGHHCITGRTFCTSAALLVLLTDRTPVPTEMASKK